MICRAADEHAPKERRATRWRNFRSNPPTPDEAREFVDAAENRLLDLWIKLQRAQWVQETFITADTEEMAAEADEAVKAATVRTCRSGAPLTKASISPKTFSASSS